MRALYPVIFALFLSSVARAAQGDRPARRTADEVLLVVNENSPVSRTDEPLLQAIASPSIAVDRYTAGYTMAESLSAASHFTGWQDVVLGDPLCCPYFPAAKHD